MGLTYSGIHAYTEDREAIIGILESTLAPGGYERVVAGTEPTEAPSNEFFLSPLLDHWITVLPSNDLEGREFAWAEAISRAGCYALWLYLYNSEWMMYRLYRGGQLVDRYNSSSVDKTSTGNARVFKPLLVPGATIEDLDRVLRPDAAEDAPAEDRYRGTARLLGIVAAETSYADAKEISIDSTPGWTSEQFAYTGRIEEASEQ